jgi:Fic family protein
VVSEAGALLCDPARKAELETRNGVDQLDYITELVESGARELRESHVLGLQAMAIRDVYPCGGKYRDATKDVFIQNSKHEVPHCALVPSLVRDAIDWVNRETDRSALERAAYAQWRFNWIHPFAGGNGRTSRAITYLIVCMNEGRMLPGEPTMPTLIYESRDEYISALQAVDATQRLADAKSSDEHPLQPDFSVMADFLRRMLMKQFASAINRLASPSAPGPATR